MLVTATVFSPSGATSTESVTVGALEADPGQCPTYQEQSMNELGRQGFVDVQLPQNDTWSLATILGCLPTPVSLSSGKLAINVIGDNGSPEEDAGSQITAADLAPAGSDFDNSAEYPVVEALGSLNQYDRPWRGSSQGQTDYDFLDEVQGTQDDQPTPITIEVFEGGGLTVSVSASPTAVAAGRPVTFSATVSGADGSPLAYSWNFDGAAPNSTAASPKVAFANAGQYEVTLQVTDSAGAGGGAEIPIAVGRPAPAAKGKHKQKGSGTSRKSHSPTGPQKSSGNHAGSSAGSHTSTTAGKTTASPTSTATQTSTAPTSRTTTPSRAGTASTIASPTRTTTSRSRPPHHTAPRVKPPQAAPVSGPLVTGQLISDVTLLPAGVSPLVSAVPAPAASAPPARQSVETSDVPALAGALAAALLLGLGAARELRGARGWQALRPGS